MTIYETMFILQPELENEIETELVENLQALIAKLGGKIGKTDDWGKRKLAYEIDKFNEGHYYLMQFNGSHEIIPELEHFFRVNDAVIRFIIVREDE
ncbi:MAG: 30S ribosomal protein S6 [Firmicutes bacterium]|nr:30S ribosomal protein S6 [Bacillota bacterium]